MHLDNSSSGWWARRRAEREETREREARGREQMEQLRLEYPVDPSRYEKTPTSPLEVATGGRRGGFWSGSGVDSSWSGGTWAWLWGDWGGGDWGGGGDGGGGCGGG